MDIYPLLHLMVERNASDMFFSVGTNVGIKISGVTSAIKDTTLSSESIKALAYSLMDEGLIERFENEWELDFSFYDKKIGRFRVNVFKERHHVAMVIRYVKEKIPSVEELNLPPILKKLVMIPRGLILVVGTTGSGKSTTLASMIDYRNNNKTGHILTIEDPIEYMYSHKKSIINQREVGIDTQTYSTALKRAVREAPDVILIGEIRDEETMKQALRFSQSGHLCLSTLHSTNSAQTIKRIINFFPESYHQELLLDLSLNLKAVVAQRLVRTTSKDLFPAVEIMLPSPFIKELIEKGNIREISDAIEQGEKQGMQSMDSALYYMYKQNTVSLEEALRHSDSPHNLSLRIKMKGGGIKDGLEGMEFIEN